MKRHRLNNSGRLVLTHEPMWSSYTVINPYGHFNWRMFSEPIYFRKLFVTTLVFRRENSGFRMSGIRKRFEDPLLQKNQNTEFKRKDKKEIDFYLKKLFAFFGNFSNVLIHLILDSDY